jgi:YesN/AraC family two-component response regulator
MVYSNYNCKSQGSNKIFSLNIAFSSRISKIRNGDSMKIKYKTEKVKRIINDLSVLTGMNIALFNGEYEVIAACDRMNDFCRNFQMLESYKGECYFSDKRLFEKCQKSGKAESHICHAGLCDFAMPLIKNGITAGYVIMGQVRTSMSPKNFTYNSPLNRFYDATPFFTDEKVESLKNLLPQILFNDAIDFEYESIIDEIAEYINANLQKDLSIATICKKFNVSKNCLYNGFRGKFSTTVNEYISSVRIAKAKELLKKTNSTVYVIAETVGIENYTYFCKLFKNTVGISPSKFRVS